MATGVTSLMRAAIQAKLSEHTTAYYGRTRGTINSICCVWVLDSATYEENVEQYQLTVNVLGTGSDSTTDLDDKADEIWASLDHWLSASSDLIFNCYQQTRARVVDDTNANNIHQRLVFTIRQFK